MSKPQHTPGPMDRDTIRRMGEQDRLRLLVEQFARPIKGYAMFDITDVDGPLIKRALCAELEKLGADLFHGEYRFVQMAGDDPAWKGWGIRGNARHRKGWVIYDKNGTEIYRIPPDATEIPFKAAVQCFDLHMQVRAMEATNA